MQAEGGGDSVSLGRRMCGSKLLLGTIVRPSFFIEFAVPVGSLVDCTCTTTFEYSASTSKSER